MIDLSRNGFTSEEIEKALHHAKRRIDFRFELLDSNLNYKKDLKNIMKDSGNIDQDSKNSIKRTMDITMKDNDPDIDFLSDRIKPYVRFYVDMQKMSPAFTTFLSSNFPAHFEPQMLGQSEWVEFPLGVFLLTSPIRKQQIGTFTRAITCYDGLLVLQEDKFDERKYFPSGMFIHDCVKEILLESGISESIINIQTSNKSLESEIEFATGDEKLAAINQLLIQGGYTDLYHDENGIYVAKIYVNPTELQADYIYKTDKKSVVFGGYEEELDYYHVPNKWVVVRSMSDRPPLVSTFVNDNQDSPTSTVRRGRTSLKKVEIDSIPDQVSLDLYAERLAYNDSQVFGTVKFESAIMPFHSYANILDIEFEGMQGNGKYQELKWSMPLQVGGKMTHTVRRVNPI